MVITWIIIVITTGVSLIAFNRDDLFNRWKFNPYQVLHAKQWYRFLTYGILHADWFHLIVNMFVLYSFGKQVEYSMKDIFGTKGLLYYFLLYFGGICLSVIPSFE
ncbi:MAG: rhomboid family intramembrane serine protease, partial [Bacteroidota bacterium]